VTVGRQPSRRHLRHPRATASRLETILPRSKLVGKGGRSNRLLYSLDWNDQEAQLSSYASAGYHMITILGAGGVISNEVVKLLAVQKQPFRLVARHARPVPSATETISADLSDKDQAIRAVAGSSIVYLLLGLKYDHKLWAEMWPRIMANTIEACKRSGAKLIFFDNVYMYGKVSGTMTEETPFNPCSRKGEVRAKIATSLINEWKNGGLTAMIARAADFYGPETPNGLPNVLVFEPFAKNQKASWLANDSVPHSYTYTLDAARSLVALAESESAWNQTWHVATTPNPPSSLLPTT